MSISAPTGGEGLETEQRQHLDRVSPLQTHTDDGQTLKNCSVMIINIQSPMGFGLSSTSDDTDNAMASNYIGHAFATRFCIRCAQNVHTARKARSCWIRF